MYLIAYEYQARLAMQEITRITREHIKKHFKPIAKLLLEPSPLSKYLKEQYPNEYPKDIL